MDQQISIPSMEEEEAVDSRWRSMYPDAPAGSVPSDEERSVLLAEVRERKRVIESEATKMAYRAFKISWSKSAGLSCFARSVYFICIILGTAATAMLLSR